jgi:hypothetical protein
MTERVGRIGDMSEPSDERLDGWPDQGLEERLRSIATEIEIYCVQCQKRTKYMKASVDWHCVKCGSGMSQAEIANSWRLTYRAQ